MCGQALVPLTGPLLRDGFHEVPLQLTDTGMMLEQVLLGLIELLYGGKDSGKAAGKRVPGNLTEASEDRW